MKSSWFAPWRRKVRSPAGSESSDLVCREAVELVTAYLDDALEPGPRAALERHLVDCPHCSEYFAQIRLVRQTAAHVEPEDLVPDARRDLMALYRQWRADPDSAAAEAPGTEAPDAEASDAEATDGDETPDTEAPDTNDS